MINLNKTFDNFQVTPESKKAFDLAKLFPNTERGLYLFGPAGVGKTHLAIATYTICNNDRKFVPVPELLLRIRSSFSKYVQETEQEIIDELASEKKVWKDGTEITKPQVEFLFLDDFGAEKISDFSIETLYLILDRRIRLQQYKVFITSNLSLKQIGEKISDRIASRIVELCDIVKITGEDWRLKR